jgi:hypothetical protein
MTEKFEKSLADGPHFELSRLAGEWEGIARTWFEPGKLADESPVKGKIRSILGGRFVMHEYEGSLSNAPLQGIAIIGYHLALRKYQVAWVDSFHNGTAIMLSEGKRDTTEMNVTGSYAYVTPGLEQHWGWRTTIELVNEDELVLRAYNVSPEGQEDLATEAVYKRVSPGSHTHHP